MEEAKKLKDRQKIGAAARALTNRTVEKKVLKDIAQGELISPTQRGAARPLRGNHAPSRHPIHSQTIGPPSPGI